jgi:ribosomal-protein-alanine N-acetyltransferase
MPNKQADADVRFARVADAPAIARMSRHCIEHGLPWSWRPDRVARAIGDADTNVIVVGDASALAGFGIMSYPDDDAHLLLLAVHPAQRRRGVGSAILGWLEAVARAAGTRRIRLEARRDNDTARHFYAEHGYHERRITKAMYCQRLDGIHLEKWLHPAA